MKRRQVQNELLDRVGHSVLKTSRQQDDEIDRIVAAPHMFELVRARIEAGETGRRSKNVGWTSSVLLSWRTAAVAGVLAIFFGAVGLGVFTNRAEVTPTADRIPNQIEQPVNHAPILVHDQAEASAKVETVNRKQAFKAKPRKLRAKRQPRMEREEVGEFYALTYAGDEDADAQIVRVDLPRSALFAMGIDMPVENGAAKIKADLLIGSDGVTRAVRIVN
ncbi:MAG TPA: hypothetical protein VJL58_11600 [Pyrinomonadaceae bacterium]|nr:hypothetical protein [Pyrinomonadaceae bacterium]